MAATLSGAIKAYLEAQGLGISVYKDAPPKAKAPAKTAPMPYCTVIENIALKMDPLEDGGPANGGEATGTELVQLDLWQIWRDDADKTIESATLPDAITEAIHGARLNSSGTGTPPKRVYAVLQTGRVRILDRDARLVHHAYTLTVHRVI